MFKNRWVCVSLRHMLLFNQGVRKAAKKGKFGPYGRVRGNGRTEINLVSSIVWQFIT